MSWKLLLFLLPELVILLKVSFCALSHIYSQVIKQLFICAAQCLCDNLPIRKVLNKDGWLFDSFSIIIGVLLIKNIHLIGVDFTTFIKCCKKAPCNISYCEEGHKRLEVSHDKLCGHAFSSVQYYLCFIQRSSTSTWTPLWKLLSLINVQT